ncbi:hypothetical protein SAMN05421548_11928 [Paraburkholderia lycopersici]|uniref:Uncharacterized protein n=1 Tax=Paraburkholderia lycopersici TaxID=416944 RepID=A0A1G6ULD0_9BURK|nr:hypothetical protein SAMN05421548_11928 [Paraburkholderia lycopersici]
MEHVLVFPSRRPGIPYMGLCGIYLDRVLGRRSQAAMS